MPLLTSPIDGSPMKEIERYGIKLDLCSASGGIWFDKGEVEKLIHFVREEALKEQGNVVAHSSSTSYSSDDYHREQKNHYRKKKRTNPLAEILEMFEG